MRSDRDVARCLTRREDTGRVQSQRLANHGPRVGKLLQGRGPEPARGERGVGFGAQPCPHTGCPRGTEQRPRERRRGRVVAGRDERHHLIADLGVGEVARREQELEHVARVVRRLRAMPRDLGVDDGVELRPCRANAGPPRKRERVWKLSHEGLFEVGLRGLDESVDLRGARAEGGSEQRVDHDAQHESAADREEVDDTIGRCDRLVDCGVGLVDDHRHPAVEAAPGKRRLRDASTPTVVVAVGHDHRSVADVEAQHVQPVSPEKRVRRRRVELGQVRRVADHDHPHDSCRDLERRAELRAQRIERRARIAGETAGRRDGRGDAAWSGNRHHERTLLVPWRPAHNGDWEALVGLPLTRRGSSNLRRALRCSGPR